MQAAGSWAFPVVAGFGWRFAALSAARLRCLKSVCVTQRWVSGLPSAAPHRPHLTVSLGLAFVLPGAVLRSMRTTQMWVSGLLYRFPHRPHLIRETLSLTVNAPFAPGPPWG